MPDFLNFSVFHLIFRIDGIKTLIYKISIKLCMLRAVVVIPVLLLLVLSTGCMSMVSGQGSVVVSSSHSGVDVYLDGTNHGQTPLTLQNIPEGLHTLEFRYKNQPGWSTQVYVPRGGSSSVQLVFAGDILESLLVTPKPGITPPAVTTTAPEGNEVHMNTTSTVTKTPLPDHSVTVQKTRTSNISNAGMAVATTRTIVPKTTSTLQKASSTSRIQLVDPVIAYKGLGDYVTKIKVEVGLRKGADGINMRNPTIKEWTESFSTEPYWEIIEKKYANGDDILTDGEIFVYMITTPKLYSGDVFSMSITPENNEPGIVFTRILPKTLQMDNVL